MLGAIESAALVVDKSWRVGPKAKAKATSQITSCRSLTPLKSPTSAPAHSARPPQNDHPPDFCDFHFARHWPSEMQKTYAPWILMRFCIKNVSCKTHFACIFALHHLFFQFFTKMWSPPRVGSTFLKNDFEHLRSKISLF